MISLVENAQAYEYQLPWYVGLGRRAALQSWWHPFLSPNLLLTNDIENNENKHVKPWLV